MSQHEVNIQIQQTNGILQEEVTNFPEDIPFLHLRKKKPGRWKDLGVLYFVLFTSEAARGMVLTSLYLYLLKLGGDKAFLGLIIGVFSVGRFLGSFLFGWIFNRYGAQKALFSCLMISIVGHALYFLGINRWILFMARFLSGTGSGVLSVIRAGISAVTLPEERAKYLALCGAIQFVGFSIVPIAITGLTYVHFQIGPVLVDRFNSSGLVLVILNLIGVLLTFFLTTHHEENHPKESHDTETVPKMKRIIQVSFLIWLNFVARGVLSLLETVGPPLFLEIHHETEKKNLRHVSQLYFLFGLGSLLIFGLIPFLQRILRGRSLLALSFLCLGAGCLFLVQYRFPLTLVQYLCGSILLWSIGSPVATTVILSTFSIMLGSKPQGTMMGFIGAAGSIGRIVVPILSGIVDFNISFISSAVVCFLCFVLIIFFK